MAIPRKALQVDFTPLKGFPASYARVARRTAKGCFLALPAKCRHAAGATPRIAVHIIGPAPMRRLNAKYRGKDRPTDVLAFSSLETKIPSHLNHYAGEVFICWQVAKLQASTFFCTPKQELQRLVVHGILHLFGYDHEKGPREAKKMFALQEKILKRL